MPLAFVLISLNQSGHKLMKLLPKFLAGLPIIAEYEFAGLVADANGSEFTIGESVFGYNLVGA